MKAQNKIKNSDLEPENINNLIFNLEKLKENIANILKQINKYKDIDDIEKKISDFLIWITKFKDGKYEKNDDYLSKRDKFINLINKDIDSFFKEDEKLNNLIKVSKSILDNINMKFEPPDNFQEENNSENNYMNISNEDVNLYELINMSDNKEYSKKYPSYFKNNDKNEKSPNSSIKIDINNNEVQNLPLKNYKEEFLKNFSKVIKILTFKCSILADSTNDDSELPMIKDMNDNTKILEYLTNIFNFSSNNTIQNVDYSQSREILNKTLKNYLDKIFENQDSDEEKNLDDFSCDEEIFNEAKKADQLVFDEIKQKLLFFINIFSKENKIFNNEDFEIISQKISDYLNIQNTDLFILQNAPVLDNFVKSHNFNIISVEQIKSYPSFSKLYELKLLRSKLLYKELKIDKEYFDYRGNFLNPNTSRNIFRGKEIYDPPYGWMGLGLNVLGKYENDKWLEDISNKSEWAIAYRGIISKDSNKIKDYLKYFIKKRDLKIAEINLKNPIDSKRRWKTIKSGIYMTPYIKIAEKHTQIISFDNKNYKVLLMAKVKIREIVEPTNSNFWILNNEDIRIYRVLFKEVN